MKKVFLIACSVGVLLFSASFVYAQCPELGGGFGPSLEARLRCLERPNWETWTPEKGLKLTPEQRAKLSELRKKFRQDNAQVIGAIVAKRIELQSLWSDPKSEEKSIQEKAKELQELKNRLQDKSLQMRLEARKFLTTEQMSHFGHGKGFHTGWRPERSSPCGSERERRRGCRDCY